MKTNFIELLDKNKKNVVVCSNSLFEELFKMTLKENFLYNIRFKSYPDLVHDFLGGFELDIEYEIAKNLNISYDASSDMLDCIMLREAPISEESLKELEKADKKTLLSFNKKDEIYKYYIDPLGLSDYQNSNIIIVESMNSNILELKALDMLRYSFSNIKYLNIYEAEEKNHFKKEYRSTLKEVEGAAEYVSRLIYNNVNINNIKIMITDNSYKNLIDDIFPFYNLEYYYNERVSLFSLEEVIKFVNAINEYIENNNPQNEYNIEVLKEYCNSEFGSTMPYEIRKKLETLLTGFTSIDSDYFEYLLKHTYINMPKYNNAIEISDNLLDGIIDDDKYIVILGAHQSFFPSPIILPGIYTKELVSASSNYSEKELNTRKEEFIFNKVKTIKNLYISYSLLNESKVFIKASLIDRIDSLKEYIVNPNDFLRFSKRRDAVKYYKAEDLYNKYGIKTTDYIELSNLRTAFKDNRDNYDSELRIDDIDSLRELLDNKISASYSSLDEYISCPLKHFYDKILRLEPFDTNYHGYLGSFFHLVMEKFFDKPFDEAEFHLLYEKYRDYKKENDHYELSIEEQYYFKFFYNVIPDMVETIKNMFNGYRFDSALKEKKFSIVKEVNGFKVDINGSIDLVLTDNEGNLTVVDYKTGSYSKIDLENKKGIQMPVYAICYNEQNNNKYKPFALIYITIDKKLEKEPYVFSNGEYLSDQYRIDSINPTKSVLPKNGKIEPTEFENIFTVTKNIIDETISDLTEFKLISNNEKNNCRYCDFKEMCDKHDFCGYTSDYDNDNEEDD